PPPGPIRSPGRLQGSQDGEERSATGNHIARDDRWPGEILCVSDATPKPPGMAEPVSPVDLPAAGGSRSLGRGDSRNQLGRGALVDVKSALPGVRDDCDGIVEFRMG